MSVSFRQKEQTMHANEARFNDAMCQQLSTAYNLVKQESYRLAERPGGHLGDVTTAAFLGNTPCTQDACTASSFPLRVYRYEASSDAEFASLHARAGMFISHGGVEAALAIGAFTGSKQSIARLLLHVCGRFCPSFTQSHKDPLHADELRSAALASTVHFCNVHARFHICDDLCAYQDLSDKDTSICALSRKVSATENTQFSFGDGTGSRERADKSDQNIEHGLDGGGVGGARRKRNAAHRLSIRSASAGANATPLGAEAQARETEAQEAKKRARRTESAAKRKKASKMRGKPTAIDLEPLVVWLQPTVMKFLPSTLSTSDVLIEDTKVTLRRVPPFEYRKNGQFDHEFALDELRRLHNRSELFTQFRLGRSAEQNTFFTDENLLCLHLVVAYELVEYMLFGEQVRAIARQTFERAHAVARRAVQQYIGTCRKEGKVLVFETLDQIYVEALTGAHEYVCVVIDESLRRTALTYYALLIVEFYFGLLALDVDVPPEDTHSAYATVRKEFAFEYWVTVIVDMMHSGNYMLDNIVVLPRDTFIIGEYCPNAGVMRQLGLSEHMANTLKTLLKQLIEIARRKTPMRVLQATTLAWSDLAALARTASPADARTRTIKLFLAARSRRIADMMRVVQPLDAPHSVVLGATKQE